MQTRLFVIALVASASPAFADDEPKGYFLVGAGYNSDDSFIARAEVGQPDLFGTGHRLTLGADISARAAESRLAYEIPDLAGLDVKAELIAGQRRYPWFERESMGGALTIGKRIDRHTRIFTRYRAEQVTVTPDVVARATNSPPPMGDGLYAAIGAGFEYTTLDTPFLPTRGTRIAAYAERADHRFGSDFDLDSANLSLDHARPLGPFTLRLHGHAGAIYARDGGAVPLAYRLFHDGNREVRGYGYDESTRNGDNLEASGRVELELPVWRRAGLSVAGWFDAGWRHNSDAAWGGSSSLLQRSAGMSVIWRSPIGPLRFDWAIPLDAADRHPRFLFNVGASF